MGRPDRKQATRCRHSGARPIRAPLIASQSTAALKILCSVRSPPPARTCRRGHARHTRQSRPDAITAIRVGASPLFGTRAPARASIAVTSSGDCSELVSIQGLRAGRMPPHSQAHCLGFGQAFEAECEQAPVCLPIRIRTRDCRLVPAEQIRHPPVEAPPFVRDVLSRVQRRELDRLSFDRSSTARLASEAGRLGPRHWSIRVIAFQI
jgi:hypothetical protein